MLRMLRNDPYIFQNIDYTEHSVGDHINAWCCPLNITYGDADSTTAVFDQFIFVNKLKSTHYDVVSGSLWLLVCHSHLWHM